MQDSGQTFQVKVPVKEGPGKMAVKGSSRGFQLKVKSSSKKVFVDEGSRPK